MNTTGALPRTDFDEEGWVQIPHADWKSDAAHARKPLLALLKQANACRLEAMATLRTEATKAIGTVHPRDPDQVEQCLWPPLSSYALQLFDKIAEQKLNGKPGVIRSRAYGRWLTLKCLPGVVDDICVPIFGQFIITVRHAAELVGEGQALGEPFVLQALRETLAREFSTTSPTKTLRMRLESLLEARSLHWEAESIRKGPDLGTPRKQTPKKRPRNMDRSKWDPKRRQVIETYEQECAEAEVKLPTVKSIFMEAGVRHASNGYAALRGDVSRKNYWHLTEKLCCKDKPHLREKKIT